MGKKTDEKTDEKTVLFICKPRHIGQAVEQIKSIVSQGITKIIIEESNAQKKADCFDKLLMACEKLVVFTDEVLPQADKLCFSVGNLNNALCLATPVIAKAKKIKK